MGRNTGSAAAASNNNVGSSAARAPGAFEKASGFVNFSLRDKEGAKVKLGYIPLLDSNERQKKLVEWLKADPKNVEIFARKLIVEFNPGQTGPAADFDLE